MIQEMQSPLLLNQILKMAEKVPGTPIEVLRNKLINGMRRNDAKVYLYEKDGEVIGFIFATSEEYNGEDAVWIQFCVTQESASPSVTQELLGRVKNWGKELGFKDMYFVTERSAKAFERRYKFTTAGTLMRRGI